MYTNYYVESMLWEFLSGLVVKNSALSLLWFDPGLGTSKWCGSGQKKKKELNAVNKPQFIFPFLLGG